MKYRIQPCAAVTFMYVIVTCVYILLLFYTNTYSFAFIIVLACEQPQAVSTSWFNPSISSYSLTILTHFKFMYSPSLTHSITGHIIVMAQSIYNIMQEATDRAATEAAFVSSLGTCAVLCC